MIVRNATYLYKANLTATTSFYGHNEPHGKIFKRTAREQRSSSHRTRRNQRIQWIDRKFEVTVHCSARFSFETTKLFHGGGWPDDPIAITTTTPLVKVDILFVWSATLAKRVGSLGMTFFTDRGLTVQSMVLFRVVVRSWTENSRNPVRSKLLEAGH